MCYLSKPLCILITNDPGWRRVVTNALYNEVLILYDKSLNDANTTIESNRYPVVILIIDKCLVSNPSSLQKFIQSCKSQVLVVVSATIPTVEDAVDFMLAGAVDYIVKTTNPDEFLRKIMNSIQAAKRLSINADNLEKVL